MSLLTDPCRGSGDASAAFSTGLHDSTGEEGGESCVGVVTGVSCVPLGPAPLLSRSSGAGPGPEPLGPAPLLGPAPRLLGPAPRLLGPAPELLLEGSPDSQSHATGDGVISRCAAISLWLLAGSTAAAPETKSGTAN